VKFVRDKSSFLPFFRPPTSSRERKEDIMAMKDRGIQTPLPNLLFSAFPFPSPFPTPMRKDG